MYEWHYIAFVLVKPDNGMKGAWEREEPNWLASTSGYVHVCILRVEDVDCISKLHWRGKEEVPGEEDLTKQRTTSWAGHRACKGGAGVTE